MKKIFFLTGTVGYRATLKNMRKWYKDLAKEDEAYLFISSGGGSIIEGLSMLNFIKSVEQKTTAVISFAGSMATQIALSCDNVLVFDQSIFMIHNAAGFAGGDYREMRKKAKMLEGMNTLLSTAYINKTGKSEKEIAEMMDDETWIFGKDIVKGGFADDLLKDDTLKALMKDLEVDTSNLNENFWWMDSAKIKEEAKNLLEFESEMMEKDFQNHSKEIEISLKSCIGNCDINKNLDDTIDNTNIKNKETTEMKNQKNSADLENKAPSEEQQTKPIDNNSQVGSNGNNSNSNDTEIVNDSDRLREIMNIPNLDLTNDDIKNLIADGASANDVKAKMYDLSLVARAGVINDLKKDDNEIATGIDSINGKAPNKVEETDNIDIYGMLEGDEKELAEDSIIAI